MSRARVLYVSSSIGLGHAGKDLAVAAELRRQRPDIDIAWLAAQPASDVLREAGECVLPEASRWRGASGIAERCVRDGRLDLVRYVYRSLPSWALNARLFDAVVRAYGVDIAVADEAYEIDIPLVLGVLRVPVPFMLLLDFVGTDAFSQSARDRLAAWLLNALWALDGRVYRRPPHSVIFIGELEDIPQRPLGRGLPDRREHARRYYDVVGHSLPFDPACLADRQQLRRDLGLGDEPLVVCAVGGTSVGADLLELCAASAAPLRAVLPGARVVLVAGPRIDPARVPAPEGVTVLGYVPRLYEFFAACDAAVVQCGAGSTTELAALGRPFVYVPIEGHFEQEVVAARLARHGAGHRAMLRSLTPETLAGMVAGEMGREGRTGTLPVDGARRAALHILHSLDRAAARRGRF